MHEFLGDVQGFLTEIFCSLAARKIDVSSYELDHICYRVESLEEYIEMKEKLNEVGKCLGEHLISGRPIATYKLHEPILFTFAHQLRSIGCVELPSPKITSPHPTGLEHAEFVIDCSFETFLEMHSGVDFETQGIGKKHHPQIELQLERFAVKFHHLPLEKVIEIESGH